MKAAGASAAGVPQSRPLPPRPQLLQPGGAVHGGWWLGANRKGLTDKLQYKTFYSLKQLLAGITNTSEAADYWVLYVFYFLFLVIIGTCGKM